MGILSTIQRKKEQFHNATVERRKEMAIKESERLRAERLRQGELAKANAERVRLERDVQRLESFNRKAEGPSNFQKFATGLKKTINKSKTEVRSIKKTSASPGKGFRLSAPQSSGSKSLEVGSNRDIFGGSKDNSRFGPSRNLFGEEKKPMPQKQIKSKTIIKYQ